MGKRVRRRFFSSVECLLEIKMELCSMVGEFGHHPSELVKSYASMITKFIRITIFCNLRLNTF